MNSTYHDAKGWELVVRPPSRWTPLELGELWAYRELLFFLVWRNIKIRYKQTALGAAWALLQPLLAMLVFSLFFGRLAGMPSDGLPYPLFVYTALVPWTYFANTLGQASQSLVEHERMITKIYFPRLLLPLAAVLSGLLDLAIALALLGGLVVWYGVTPSAALVTLPLFIALAALAALGVGLWLAALHVQYRDVRYVTPFLIQFWLFATPIAYPSSLVPEAWRALLGLNPMAGVVEGFRWAVLGQAHLPLTVLAVSLLVTAGVLIGGLYYFRRVEDSFADVI